MKKVQEEFQAEENRRLEAEQKIIEERKVQKEQLQAKAKSMIVVKQAIKKAKQLVKDKKAQIKHLKNRLSIEKDKRIEVEERAKETQRIADGKIKEHEAIFQKIVNKDERFIKYDNDIVYDFETDLEWLTGHDKNKTWDEAKKWAEGLSLNGSGWRLPTRDELKSLYKKGVGTRNMTPFLKTTGWWVWSSKHNSSFAWNFFFGTRQRRMEYRTDSCSGRCFAVRSLKE